MGFHTRNTRFQKAIRWCPVNLESLVTSEHNKMRTRREKKLYKKNEKKIILSETKTEGKQ